MSTGGRSRAVVRLRHDGGPGLQLLQLEVR